jgi:hypothetical protein
MLKMPNAGYMFVPSPKDSSHSSSAAGGSNNNCMPVKWDPNALTYDEGMATKGGARMQCGYDCGRLLEGGSKGVDHGGCSGNLWLL